MNTLCWNCRGLGSPKAVRHVRRLVRECAPHILFLSETKLSEVEAEALKWSLGYECGIFVGCQGTGRARSGGLVLLWRRDMSVHLLSYSRNHVDVEVHDSFNWRFTGFYGWPTSNEKHKSWSLLQSIRNHSTLPWMCRGDFNEILSNAEKRGGQLIRSNRLDAFNGVIQLCGFKEITQKGLFFTWSNGQENEAHVECKLDRIFVTQDWYENFPAFITEALPRIGSDHSPLWCKIRKELPRVAGRRFRFESMWVRHEELPNQIAMAWNNLSVGKNIADQIEGCADSLMEWSRVSFGNVRKRKKELEEAIKTDQSLPLDSVRKIWLSKLIEEREELLVREEMMWAQRSRVEWLREGDRNSKFFHQKVSHRKHRNWVEKIRNEEGVEVRESGGIQEIFRNYYISLFTSSGCEQVEAVSRTVQSRTSPEAAASMTALFSSSEVKTALFEMHPTKSPGPDGMSPLFFQKFWPIVGNDVVAAALAVLNEGLDPSHLNKTIIALIPKAKKPSLCSEYRPISLCNVIMKIITKTIANRLKTHLSDIIHENQGAFVPGRLISDNSLVAFEIFHYLKKRTKGKRGFCALKLDMMKAYDRIEWPFLEHMMLALGIPSPLIKVIMGCVTTVQYSVQINGEIGEYFTPSRGLRQGDPISPYLFLFCAEGLAGLLQQAEATYKIHGIKVARHAPSVSHLFFADDSLLFARASKSELRNIMEILQRYEKASGQKINLQKSSATFSNNVSKPQVAALLNILQMRTGTTSEKYLGLPTILGRSKKAVFAELEDRIRQKVSGWKERFLSRAGRETLIKSVLQSIPTYIMSCFLLPGETCDRMQKLLCGFFWGSSNGERKIHWRRWERMCQPKNVGGLGFRRLQNFNRAMLAKQAWRLLTCPTSLTARILKAKYYPRCHILQAPLGYSPSFTWRSLYAGLSLLAEGLEWRIGDGSEVDFWSDRWLPDNPLGHPAYRFPGMDCFRTVSEFITPDPPRWNLSLLESLLLPHEVNQVAAINLSSRRQIDVLRWKHTHDGIYSVRSGYYNDFLKWMSTSTIPDQQVPAWHTIWSLNRKVECPPRIKIFFWRALDENLPTRNNLLKRGINLEGVCPLCNTHLETTIHLFFKCPQAQTVWRDLGIPIGTLVDASPLQWWTSTFTPIDMEEAARRMCGMWGIWRYRNAVVFQPLQETSMQEEVSKALKLLSDFQKANTSTSNTSEMSPIRWTPPDTGWIKVNTDASLSASGSGQVGAFLRDTQGTFIAAAIRKHPLVSHPTLMEAMGVQFGAELAISMGFRKVILESDCQPVIKAIQHPTNDRSDLALIVSDIVASAQTFDHYNVSFVRRQANLAAHTVAKMLLNDDVTVQLFSSPPDCLLDIIQTDMM